MEQKIERENIFDMVTYGYVVAFIHPVTNQFIFLDKSADIKALCYCENPKLPGTSNIRQAKTYTSLAQVKYDIYLLRYHHRGFIKIKTVAKPINYFNDTLYLNNSKIPILYEPSELYLE